MMLSFRMLFRIHICRTALPQLEGFFRESKMSFKNWIAYLGNPKASLDFCARFFFELWLSHLKIQLGLAKLHLQCRCNKVAEIGSKMRHHFPF